MYRHSFFQLPFKLIANMKTETAAKLPPAPGGLVALMAAFFLLAGLSSWAATPSQPVLEHVPAAARSRAVDRLPAARQLNLEISLPLRNREALTNLLRDLSNPASPNYRRYLTPEQFAAQFGPTEQDYRALLGFATAHRLAVIRTHPNRTLLNVSGSVADIERAFHVNLLVYRHPVEARNFFAPDAEPSLDVTVPTLSVGGLDDYVLPRPMNLRVGAFRKAASLETNAPADALPDATGSGPRGSFIGKDFRAAYAPGVALTGAGQTVGVLEFDGYYPQDITAYERLAGLPNVTLTNVLLDSMTGSAGGNNIEVALDIDMAISMAPGLSRVIVYEGNTGDDIYNRMATDNLAKQLSSSWTFGSTMDATREQIFQQFAAQGQTMFQASGDLGAYPGGIYPPADDPLVTVVGGTSLTTGPGGVWQSETVWPDSGGGISTYFPIPVWQQGLSMTASQGSATKRNIPDVAALADSVIWLIANNGEEGTVGGTSASAPMWAGFLALANQQAAASSRPAVGFANPAFSAIAQGSGYSAAFHDITNGNNTNPNSPSLFYAVPGYDLCTGWGTPAGSNLIAALVSPPDPLLITPPTSAVAVGPVGGPFSPAAQTYSLISFSTNAVNWALSNSAPWLDVSPLSGAAPTNAPASNVTLSLNAAASNLPAGSYVATVWFTNLNDNFVQSRQFTLDVITPPMITSQPSNQTALPGGTATFTVGTAANAQLFFQWQKNGSNLADGGNVAGSATSTLTLNAVAAADAGNYDVIASNALGSVTSSNAVLTVASVTAPGVAITTLYAFGGGNDGGNPNGLIQAASGILYGTTQSGGSNQSGTVFQMPPGGAPAGLYSFTGGGDGGHPQAALAQGNDGTLYGTTFDGGDSDNGTVFKISTNGGLATLLSFEITNGDLPFAGLTLGQDGSFYGTTYQGGGSGRGTAFRITTGGLLTTLYSFTDGADGGFLHGGLAQGADGNFYGTTFKGGTANDGTVFRLTTNGVLNTLVQFAGTNGSFPYAGLAKDESGNFYGVTANGGAFGNGAIFRLTAAGAFSNLYSFTGSNDGAQPTGGLVEGPDGNIYGTTAYGGAYGDGTVFRLTATGVFSTLVQFDGINGANPAAALLSASDGALYGATQNGGAAGAGVIFRLNLNEGPLQILTQPASQSVFSGATVSLSVAIEGSQPVSYRWFENGTNLSDGGNISGSATRVLTINNATTANAAIYSVIVSNAFGPVTSQNAILEVIVSPPLITTQPTNLSLSPGATAVFNVAAIGSQPLNYQWRKNGANLSDGGNIAGSQGTVLTVNNVTEADNGAYSVLVSNPITSALSSSATLTVVPASAAGTRFATLHSFAGGTDGSSPSRLTPGTDGNLYGTTKFGGANQRGSVFRVSTNGTVTTVASFSTNGFGPVGGVTQGLDGNFYGTTLFGGASNAGNVFVMTPAGVLSNRYSFTGGADGNAPTAPLLRGADGSFYGTTQLGGNFAAGNVFRITPGGAISNFYSFTDGLDGGFPTNALMQGTDGNFYGVTPFGGPRITARYSSSRPRASTAWFTPSPPTATTARAPTARSRRVTTAISTAPPGTIPSAPLTSTAPSLN